MKHRKAFVRLIEMEIVKPNVENLSTNPLEYVFTRLMITPEKVIEALHQNEECPLSLKKWGEQWLE
jgi:hypothetical protein